MIALLFVRRYWQWFVIGFLCTTAIAYCRARDAGLVREGIQRERYARLAAQQERDSSIVVRWDTLVVHDTIRLTKTLTRFDTLRATLNIHDTVEVLRFVASADSAVRQCRVTVSTLLSSCAAKDTLIATLRQLRETSVTPSLTWKTKLGYTLLGAAVYRAVRR